MSGHPCVMCNEEVDDEANVCPNCYTAVVRRDLVTLGERDASRALLRRCVDFLAAKMEYATRESWERGAKRLRLAIEKHLEEAKRG